MARVHSNSITHEFIPETKLLSCTSNPVGTLFSVWHMSRWEDEVDPTSIEDLYWNYKDIDDPISDYLIKCYPEYIKNNSDNNSKKAHDIIREVVKLAIKCDVPASEFVSVELCTNKASVAWREQMVRNRRIHTWLQTSRTADMTSYDCNRIATIRQFGGDEAVKIYDNAVQMIRDTYKTLIEMGVPSEDIRLQTQGHIHRCMWGMDLRNLIKLVSKRASFIAQASLWGPINADVIDILREMFGEEIIQDFVGKCEDITYHKDDNGNIVLDNYKYINESEDRYYGKDYQPTDPLYLAFTKKCLPEHTDIKFYDYMKSMYIKMWNSDILSILGWDRSNPEKVGKFDRPYSWFEKNNKLDIIKGLSHEK